MRGIRNLPCNCTDADIDDYIGITDFEIPDDEECIGLHDDIDENHTVALPFQLPDLDIPF